MRSLRNKIRRSSATWFSVLCGGLVFQSGCPLAEDFDPLTLFAQAASTIITDSIFFALDTLLISAS